MSNNLPVILMVEDDPNVLELNKKILARRGFETRGAKTLQKARELLRNPCDLVLLDITLPDGSGLDFISEIRAATSAPILMLTSKKEASDIVEGLITGADDYLTKPYRLDELYARIVALLRRVEIHSTQRRDPQKFGPITLDEASARAYCNGRDILLNPKEFALLLELFFSRDDYITGNALYEKLWGVSAGGDDHAVRTQIYRLRKKLEAVSDDVAIEQEKNRGYRLVLN